MEIDCTYYLMCSPVVCRNVNMIPVKAQSYSSMRRAAIAKSLQEMVKLTGVFLQNVFQHFPLKLRVVDADRAATDLPSVEDEVVVEAPGLQGPLPNQANILWVRLGEGVVSRLNLAAASVRLLQNRSGGMFLHLFGKEHRKVLHPEELELVVLAEEVLLDQLGEGSSQSSRHIERQVLLGHYEEPKTGPSQTASVTLFR